MARYSWPMSRATVVFPVPGLPTNTRWRDRGGVGRPAASRRRRTFMRFTRLWTSAFTPSSPTRASSWARSSSKVGWGSAASACFGAGWGGAGSS